MPAVTRYFIKTSLVYLVVALVAGALLAANRLWALPALLGGIGPTYFHMFMVGWVTQLIFGVVYWMFPIVSREQPRGSARLGWWTYGLLNAGLLLRVVGEPVNAQWPGAWVGWLLVLSAVLQWAAAITFVANTWRRVKPGPRQRRREARKQAQS